MNFARSLHHKVHPDIRGLARYCAELAGDTALPRRSCFRPSRVAPVITFLFLIDVLKGDGDYLFSLFGSNMATLYGEDLTGKRLSTVGDAALRAGLRKTYDHVVTTAKPLYLRGRYEWPRLSIHIERLLVPMTDDSGAVTTILGVAIPDVDTDTLLVYAGKGPARLVVDDILSVQ